MEILTQNGLNQEHLQGFPAKRKSCNQYMKVIVKHRLSASNKDKMLIANFHYAL